MRSVIRSLVVEILWTFGLIHVPQKDNTPRIISAAREEKKPSKPKYDKLEPPKSTIKWGGIKEVPGQVRWTDEGEAEWIRTDKAVMGDVPPIDRYDYHYCKERDQKWSNYQKVRPYWFEQFYANLNPEGERYTNQDIADQTNFSLRTVEGITPAIREAHEARLRETAIENEEE